MSKKVFLTVELKDKSEAENYAFWLCEHLLQDKNVKWVEHKYGVMGRSEKVYRGADWR